MRRNLSTLAALTLAGSFALAGAGTAEAATLPAPYSGSAHGDIVSLDVSVLSNLLNIPSLAGVTVAHAKATADSTATPATTAESKNVHASVASLNIPVDTARVDAAPNDSYDRDLLPVQVPSLLGVGVIHGAGAANWAGTTACVPAGTPLSKATTQLAGVNLGLTQALPTTVTSLLPGGGLTIAKVDASATTSTTYLSNGSMVAKQTTDVGDIHLLNDLARVHVVSPAVLTATSSGSGAGTVTYSNPTATVTLANGQVINLPVSGAPITLPLTVDLGLLGKIIANVTLALAPAPSDTAAGTAAAAAVPNVLSVDVKVTTTGTLQTLLGASIADVDLGVATMDVRAAAPTSGVQCVSATDADGDGLTDAEEAALGTDPHDADTDNDGLTDGAEVNTHGTKPLDADTDDDGLKDGAEVNTHGTDPKDPDTDNGGVKDGAEVAAGTNPLDGSDDAALLAPGADPDGDGLTNAEEKALGTDPFDADTDNDGLKDGREVELGTDPLDADTDNDGLKDGAEVNKYGTDPKDADTDNGGVKDGAEVKAGTDPLDASDDRVAGGQGSGSGDSDDNGWLPSTGATIGLGALLAALGAVVAGLVMARKRRLA
ncbi:hypothetical protein [Nocardioides cavernaquae]|uniref:Gram-positive cocci surface proteins LPxTG domain-containing protein n=1 Tax=Nocardioides cavernaquae TaxID=2321396 RepID=A0A3A5HBB0_9ACTN|nr:hypothetical protein [Nocardioides cavernaquae]RJS47592.1 hypothetical protein D4739_16170 [Nocardioides cavernaquae]